MTSMATFSRIKAPIACAIVLAAVLACGVMWIPDYGKDIYSETKAVDYDEYKDQTGFPAGNGYEELTKVEEIINTDHNYIVNVDTKDIKPANTYKDILGTTYYYKKSAKYIDSNTNGGVATFYVIELKSGEKILALIDDRAFTLPQTGCVELPVASTKRITNKTIINKLENSTGLSSEEVRYYVDTAGIWRKSPDGEKIKEEAQTKGAIVFIMVSIVGAFLFTYIEKREEKKQGE